MRDFSTGILSDYCSISYKKEEIDTQIDLKRDFILCMQNKIKRKKDFKEVLFIDF